ncbi:DUF1178 family protein [Gemmobacter serpentinus]|uniref:DUF1178 family protein n=1 Tax=Gemmobacter serpentinus TaxID=2652247 RepID=UPI00124E92AD|nr:DUF1178 family protein [Gemmobacter serpentinus]
MIRYALTCSNGHIFDSWFASADAFDGLRARGLVACAVCGVSQVEKALMAPAVNSPPDAAMPAAPRPDLSSPESPAAAALARLRREVEANSEYVGGEFVAEARRMHEGEAPERAIYGEARLDEARRLLEDGIPVAPLPFLPGRKAN